MTSTPKIRVIRIPEVPGRPEMNGPDIVYGAEAWSLMTQIVEGVLSLGGMEARVDRNAVQVLRGMSVPRGQG